MSKQPEALFLADVIENDPQSKAHHDAAAACLRRLHAERDALRAENDALKKQPARFSLLRKPVKHISELGPCHCPPDVCSAPVIMGVQTPCLRHAALKEVDRE